MRLKKLFHQILSPSLLFTGMLIAGLAGAGDVHAVTTTPGVGTGYNGLGKGPAPVILGLAGEYAILAKTSVSLTGTTAITGNVGISPAAASFLTGFNLSAPPTTYTTSPFVVGQVFAADYDPPSPTNVGVAVLNMQTAYTDAAGRAPDYTELAAGEIGGSTLAPGVYKWATSVLITTDVVLKGGPNDTWIFEIAGDLIQASGARVTLQDGAVAKNIFWQVGGLVDHGTTSHFEGITLSQTSIVLKTGATATGRQLAQTAVTMDANAVLQQAAVAPITKFAYGDTSKAVDTLVWVINDTINLIPKYTGGPVDSFVVTSGTSIPLGVLLNKTTGKLSGRPLSLRAAANSTITAYGPVGNATRVLRISVVPQPIDSLSYAQDTVILGVGVAAAGNAPSWSGSAPTAFAVAPILPAGLSLNPTSGVISGTPTAPSAGTNYQVIGSNGTSSDTTIVRYTVQAAPIVTTQPRDTTVAAGVTATFSVSATSAGTLSYQWRKNGVNLSNGTGILGATTATLSVGPAVLSDTGAYSVAVTGTLNGVPSMIVSNNAALKVNTAPVVATQPRDTTVISGANAAFTVAATPGAGTSAGTLSYQWRKGTTALVNTGTITGATTTTLTVGSATIADTAGNYNVVVTRTLNGVATSTNSGNAALRVNTTPVIATQPRDTTVISGVNATFMTVATTGPGTLTYQWRKGTTNVTTGTGGTTAAYTLTAATLADTAANYNVVVTRTLNGVVTSTISSIAALRVTTAPVISTQPTPSQSLVVGSNITLSVVVAPGAGTSAGALSYQWRKGATALINTGVYTGTTTPTLTLTNVTVADTGTYSVVVTRTLNGTTVPTTSANAVVNTPVGILQGSYAFRVNGGSNPYTFSLPAGITGTDLVTMRISDIWGRTVWSKSMGASSAAAREITWNGVTSAGRQASAGMYVVRVAVRRDGTTTQYTNKAVTLKPR